MFHVRLSTDCGTRARAFAFLSALLLLGPSIACNGNASGSGCLEYGHGIVIDFNADATGGFDDFRSLGAALGVAIDEGDPEMGLIIALRFTTPTVEEFYSPTCDTTAAIDSYDFAELNNVTSSHGARLVVFLIPAKFQAIISDQAAVLQRFDVDPDTLLAPQRYMQDLCADLHIPLIDSTEPIREADTSEPQFWRVNPHLNVAGNRIAAEVIAQGLVAKGVVQAASTTARSKK